MDITVIVPFNTGLSIVRKYFVNGDNFVEVFKEMIDLSNFFEGHFTPEEVKQIVEQCDVKNKKKRYVVSEKTRQKIKDKIIGKHNPIVQRKELNDAYYPIYEDIRKLENSVYEIVWGT